MTIDGAGGGASPGRPDVLGRTPHQLAEMLEPLVDRSFRVEQVHRALYEQGVRSFEEVTTLSKELRRRMEARLRIGRLQVTERYRSADGTSKLLFRLPDGASIEAVDIPDGDRTTLCLSSQAGCALGCRFCVTGYWGGGRDLTAGEIVAQVLEIRGRLEVADRLNLVFMGMGEPLLNLKAVHDALQVLTGWISWRRITVSTVGILPGLEALAVWPRRPNLAISLHAPDDERRRRIMPVDRRYPLDALLATLRSFPLERGRRVSFEYLLIRDFNEALEDADALARRIAGVPSKVNLIPINPDPVLGKQMVPPPPEQVTAFRDRLREHGVVATVRRRRGDDVGAACGQLRAASRPPRGFRLESVSI